MTLLLFTGGLVALVASGPSAPEMAVSTGAVPTGQGGRAVRNAAGSNNFRVLLMPDVTMSRRAGR